MFSKVIRITFSDAVPQTADRWGVTIWTKPKLSEPETVLNGWDRRTATSWVSGAAGSRTLEINAETNDIGAGGNILPSAADCFGFIWCTATRYLFLPSLAFPLSPGRYYFEVHAGNAANNADFGTTSAKSDQLIVGAMLPASAEQCDGQRRPLPCCRG